MFKRIAAAAALALMMVFALLADPAAARVTSGNGDEPINAACEHEQAPFDQKTEKAGKSDVTICYDPIRIGGSGS